MKNTHPTNASSFPHESTSDPHALLHALNQDSSTVANLAKQMLADTQAAIEKLNTTLSSPLSVSIEKHLSRTEGNAKAFQPKSLEFSQSLSPEPHKTPSSSVSSLPSTDTSNQSCWALSLYEPAPSSPRAQAFFESSLDLPFSFTLPTVASQAPSPFTMLIPPFLPKFAMQKFPIILWKKPSPHSFFPSSLSSQPTTQSPNITSTITSLMLTPQITSSISITPTESFSEPEASTAPQATEYPSPPQSRTTMLTLSNLYSSGETIDWDTLSKMLTLISCNEPGEYRVHPKSIKSFQAAWNGILKYYLRDSPIPAQKTLIETVRAELADNMRFQDTDHLPCFIRTVVVPIINAQTSFIKAMTPSPYAPPLPDDKRQVIQDLIAICDGVREFMKAFLIKIPEAQKDALFRNLNTSEKNALLQLSPENLYKVQDAVEVMQEIGASRTTMPPDQEGVKIKSRRALKF